MSKNLFSLKIEVAKLSYMDIKKKKKMFSSIRNRAFADFLRKTISLSVVFIHQRGDRGRGRTQKRVRWRVHRGWFSFCELNMICRTNEHVG